MNLDKVIFDDEFLVVRLYDKIFPIISSAWTPRDPSVRVFLKRLQEVSTALFDHLVDDVVLQRLTEFLRNEVTINPANQKLDEFWAVLAWRNVIRISDILDLLEKEFFPRWMRTLEEWLSRLEPERYEEVVGWYKGWKNVFEKCDIFFPSIVVEFDRALHLMNMYVKNINKNKFT